MWGRPTLLSLALYCLFVWGAVAQEVPTTPFVDLTVQSGSSVLVNFSSPLSDGGSAIKNYKVEWDTDPGVQETQVLTTSVYTGANNIQSITTHAPDFDEIQTITTNATAIADVQIITVMSATGGSFFLELDTSAQGGSLQYSGYIQANAPDSVSSDKTDVQSIISAMSNIIGGSVSVKRNSIGASTNYAYTVTFPMAMGNVPKMVVHTSQLTPSGTAGANVTTFAEGNVISGTFRLTFQGQTTADIACDASDADMRLALTQLPSIGAVEVARSIVSYQGGYSWTVTFISPMNSGNVMKIVPDSSGLKVSSSTASASMSVVSKDGNEVGGTFLLGFKQDQTSAIAFDASASDFKSALESMPGHSIPPGTVSVSRTGPDGQKGYSWTVSFLSNYNRTFFGNVPPFTFIPGSTFTGINASGTVVALRNGTIQEVQQIKVTSTQDLPSNSTYRFKLSVGSQTTPTIRVRPMASTCSASITEVQTITTSTVDTTTQGGDNDVSM